MLLTPKFIADEEDCCNRQFVQLQRHMASKHPTFLTEDVTPKDATIQ